MPPVYIALGTNINPENNIKAAVTMLRERYPAIRFSSVYRSAPLHHEKQDDFLNAVATFETDLAPDAIFGFLMFIEKHLKKNLLFRFGPRTVDMDFLLYGNTGGEWTVEGTQLALPHPRMHERRFVLEPLCELIDPQEMHPVLKLTWKELLAKTMDQKCAKTPIRL